MKPPAASASPKTSAGLKMKSNVKKSKKKPHKPYKISRANLHTMLESGVQPDEQKRIRRASLSGSQQGSSSKAGGAAKRHSRVESETSEFPQSCMVEFAWLQKFREAEKTFGSDRPGCGGNLGSRTSTSKGGSSIPGPSSAGTSSASRNLQFGRRRVESEPPTDSGLRYDYDALKNAGNDIIEEIIRIRTRNRRKLRTLYQLEKELTLLILQQKLGIDRDELERLKQFVVHFTKNPYLLSKKIDDKEHEIGECSDLAMIKAAYDALLKHTKRYYNDPYGYGLLRLKMLQEALDLSLLSDVTAQKNQDFDSDTDSEDTEEDETRDTRSSLRMLSMKNPVKCAYNEGYAARACQNSPVYLSNYCIKHILSDASQVQWAACNRHVGPDPQDTCKTPCLKVLEKHGCAIHSPLVMSKHKPLKMSEEELNMPTESDNDEEISLENKSLVLATLVSDDSVRASHLDEAISKLTLREPLEKTDTSDSVKTDEDGVSTAPGMADEVLPRQ